VRDHGLGDTLAIDDTLAEGRDARTPVTDALAGYQLGELLGRGGMGEVVLAEDLALGRSVALKRLRSDASNDEAIRRFLREARVQARLDHPAIVPVHEVGYDADGRPFFTMKRLAGVTLQQVLANERRPRPELLRAFVDVCLAIELAHAREVVHRDLKPSNIMLGDFGEVYVLDWGVARIVGDSLGPAANPGDALDGGTYTGQLLGTPGYMAPEQVRGEPVAPPADVYALGAVLFEILAGQPLHPRGHGALANTLDAPTASPAQRAPDRQIPEALDRACTAALAADPRTRPTARALAELVQQYLDGDRELEQRHADAHLAVAESRVLLARGDRANAVRAAGRALALDPGSTEAAALLHELVVEDLADPPPDLAASLEREERVASAERSRRAIGPLLAVFVITPGFFALEVESAWHLAMLYGAIVFSLGASYVNWRVRPLPLWIALLAHVLIIAASSRLLSPFVLTPIVTCMALLSVTTVAWVAEREYAVLGWVLLATLTPFALEGLELYPASWRMQPDGLATWGNIFVFEPEHATLILGGTNALCLALLASYALRISADRRAAQRRRYARKWNLQQLLPGVEARDR